MKTLSAYALRLGDNGLVLSQRLGAWCGHAPELEIDLALANIGLDLLGQARNFLTYAAELEDQGDEDTLAFGRDERQFHNVLLVEQPNGSFADTLARQYFMDAWNVALYERLTHSSDSQLAAIAAKAIKEARYHLRFSRGWLVRLGDGTETSSQRMQQAVDTLWRFTAELFEADDVELALIASGVAVDPRELRQPWEQEVFSGLQEATLSVPSEVAYRTGASAGCIPNISAQCWQKCSISSAPIRVSSGKYGGEDAAFCRNCTRGDPSNLVVVKPDPGPGSAGVNHHRFRHGA